MANSRKPGDGDPRQVDAVESQAIHLLHKALVIQSKGGSHELEITEVEPFIHKEPDSYVTKFKSKPRQPGEMMLTWSMGSPQLFVVVDNDQQRIVYLKKFRLGNNVSTLAGIAKSLGLDKNFLNGLDGKKLTGAGPESEIRLSDRPTEDIHNIRRQVGKSVNSLGILSKMERRA